MMIIMVTVITFKQVERSATTLTMVVIERGQLNDYHHHCLLRRGYRCYYSFDFPHYADVRRMKSTCPPAKHFAHRSNVVDSATAAGGGARRLFFLFGSFQLFQSSARSFARLQTAAHLCCISTFVSLSIAATRGANVDCVPHEAFVRSFVRSLARSPFDSSSVR